MVNILVILFGLSMLLATLSTRIEAHIKILAFQGFALFLLSLLVLNQAPWYALLLPVVETIVFKTVVIPLLLLRAVRRRGIYRDMSARISSLFGLAISSLIFLAGFFLAYWGVRTAPQVRHLDFGIAFSVIISGLFQIMTRKSIITHIIGFIMCENGLFLLTLAVGHEMPLLISLGMLLDIFVGIFLLVVFFNRIHAEFDDTGIDQLTSLQE